VKAAPVGIPYLLPKGHLQFSVTVKKNAEGKLEDVSIQTETKLLPDPDKIFLLEHGAGLFTHHDQKIVLEDGMLSTLHTADEGQGAEVLKSLATAWVQTLSIGALQGTLGDISELSNTDLISTGTGMPDTAFRVLSTNVELFIKHPHIPTPPTAPAAERLRAAYPELVALPVVDSIVTAFDSYKADAWARRFGRILSTQDEQKELLIEGISSDLKIVWPDPATALNEPFGRYFRLVAVRTGTYKETGTGGMTQGINSGKDSGVFVKVPQPVLYQLTMQVNSRELYLYRLAKFDATYTALTAAIADQQTALPGWKTDLAKAEADLIKLNSNIEAHRDAVHATPTGASSKNDVDTLAALKADLTDTTAKIAKLKVDIKSETENRKKQTVISKEIQTNLVLLFGMIDSWDETSQKRIDLVFNRTSSALVPSSYAINIPLNNAVLGKTAYDLEFAKGVLVKYGVNRPAALVELVKIPAEVAGTAVELLTKLVQLKISLSKQEQEYAKTQLALERTKQDLALSQVEQSKKEEGLRAEIAASLVKIKENEKKLSELQTQIDALQKP
jgi:hypothetical protein